MAEDPTASPASQALKIYKALGAQDYRALFYLMAFTEKGQATLTTAEQFAIEVRQGYESGFKTAEEKAVSDAILASISDIMVGEPVISGTAVESTYAVPMPTTVFIAPGPMLVKASMGCPLARK